MARNWTRPHYDRGYYIASDVSVSSGYTLSIGSGITVDGNNEQIGVYGNLEAEGVGFLNIARLYFQSTGGGSITICTLTDTDDTEDAHAIYVEAGSTPTLSGNTITGFDADIVYP